MRFRFSILAALALVGCMFANSCNKGNNGVVNLDVAKAPFQYLSEYNFFAGDMAAQTPNTRVVPYDLRTTLFTDYAWKARFVYMPEGKGADFDTSKVLQLPVGSCLIKTFYYPFDFRAPEKGRRIMETRLLVHRAEGWEALDYIWNEDQTEAELDIAGDVKAVEWTHYDGSKRTADYVVPNKNQCKGCHWSNKDDAIMPIGPKVQNLNRDYPYAAGAENQLAHWGKIGYLKNAPAPEACPKFPDWTDSTHYSVQQRARAYLEVNCGHCHNANGPAYTSGLLLDFYNNDTMSTGVCKTPVAAGKGSGGFSFDAVPGHPEQSIIVYRMLSDDPGVRMPEVGRSVLHAEGVALVSAWIAEMKGDCRPNH